MALNLRERFGPKGERRHSSLAADFRFVPGEYPSLRDYRVEHEEVDVLENPLAVDRLYFLAHGSDSLKVELALCLEGPDAALDLLFHRAEAFQRDPPEDAIVDLPVAHAIGDAGVAWLWGREERNGVAGFVRHNAIAFLQGRYDTLVEIARDLDRSLASVQARAGPSYVDDPSFELPQPDLVFRVPPAGRVDLGPSAKPDERHFFIAASGSVNRDPADPARHYFRAGLVAGPHSVLVLRVGAGLMPARQVIRVAIG